MKNNKWIVTFILFFFCVLGMKTTVHAEALEDTRILDDVYIGTVNVSGLTREEAVKAVAQYIDEVKGYIIQLLVDDQIVRTTAGELGLSWGNEEAVDKAVLFGQGGNLVKRYKARKDLEQESVRLTLDYGVTKSKTEAVIKEKCLPLNCEPVNAAMSREDNEFVIEKDKSGITVNEEESVAVVVDYLTNLWTTGIGNVELSVEIEAASHSAAALADVQDILGSGSTDYSSSSANRAQNIKNGTAKLNGILLYPGESYSVCDAMIPFSEENGYAMAGSYANNTVVESFGGGICQVSTTLYLALLRSELEITERQNHSMTVKYVKLSMDAAISEGSKDLQFKNNLEFPVYIEGYTSGGQVGFVVYGKEYRPESRTVEFESETLETTEPGIELTAVNEPLGKIEQTESASTGYQACLWKIVTEDGSEEKVQINKSTYAERPKKYSIGIVTSNSEASEKIQQAIKQNDLDAAYQVINNYG